MGLNFVRRVREERLMSQQELAKRAGLSPLTIDWVEKGKGCHRATKMKILQALGYRPSDIEKIFRED